MVRNAAATISGNFPPSICHRIFQHQPGYRV